MQARVVEMLDSSIPTMSVGPLTEEHDDVLLWVRSGAAVVNAAGNDYSLRAGQSIRVPAGVEHRIRTEAGTVVFPFLLHPAELSDEGGRVQRIDIDAAWADWLIHRWDDSSATRDSSADAVTVAQIVEDARAASLSTSVAEVSALALPRSREALNVARTLLDNPASPRDLDSLARRESVSSRTLQRQFRRETGLAYSQWRTRAQILIAARRLDEGRAVAWVRRHIGFATASGFTKAFQRHTGFSPRDYAIRPRNVPSRDLGGGVGSALSEVPRVPSRTRWIEIGDAHELMWVYRGDVRMRIGGRSWVLRRGDAIWVPAGVPHHVELGPESILLTVGRAHGRAPAGVDELLVLHLPHDADDFLLHAMLSEYTAIRPRHERRAWVGELFHEQFVAGRYDPGTSTGVLGEIARMLRLHPADSRSLAEWAAHLRVTRSQLGDEFMAQAGESFPRWRAQVRMSVAREWLRFGASPSQISEHLGYGSAAAFSTTFSRVHGMPPREYARRELRRAATG